MVVVVVLVVLVVLVVVVVLGPMFFLSISQTQLLRMCLFPCEAYDSRKGGQTHHPKKKWKEKTMSTNQQFLAKQPRATQ